MFENKVVNFEQLKSEVQEDIVEELKAKFKGFSDTTHFWNNSDIIEFVKDTMGLPKLIIKDVNPQDLLKQFKNRATSKIVVEKYKKMIKSGVEFDPVIVSGNVFLDGGHRVKAYAELNKKTIPAIDIMPILKYNWKKELDDSFN
jgi:ribulose 1,5-bisphosphate synthetase/thiazole synthase